MGSSDIDRVRDATDLVQLIGEHLSLKPRGREHIGLCPFHDDHTPSFAVVTHKGNAFYKCHSCGAAGDVFTFVEQYHKMSFGEALRFLAERAHITLSDRRDEARASDEPSRSDLRKATAFAGDFYRRTLADPAAGDAARQAIAQRGISDEMVRLFGLGAAPAGWDGLCGRLRGKPSAVRTAAAAGLLRLRATGDGYYDYFRNRLVFPICDETATPIAFGGRILDPDDTPKYLNSPESPIFSKSRTLYGIHLAKRAIIDSGRAIVTEGYTDVIACHQAGFANVVATLGTALTREHATMLGRLCNTVVLVFDGDEAGVKAADRAVEVFFSAPVDVRICVLPDDLDPDDLLRQDGGADRFAAALERSVDALDFKVARFRRAIAGETALSGRQKRLEAFLGELVDLGFDAMQGVRKRLVMTQLADLLGVSLPDLQATMPRRKGRSPATFSPTPTASDAMGRPAMLTEPLEPTPLAGSPLTRARRLAERDLLSLMLYDPRAATVAEVMREGGESSRVATAFAPDDFADAAARAIAAVLLPRLADGGPVVMQDVLSTLSDDAARRLAASMYFDAQSRCGDDDLAVAAQLSHAAEALLGQIHRAAGAAAVPDRLQDLIEHRRRQGHRPDAIFLGARSTDRR